MIKLISEMLQLDNFFGRSEVIDIAKGKYALPKTFKEAIKQGIRNGRKVKR